VTPTRSVAVVGGGLGGVCAAVMLRRAGYDDVTVFERDERIGGVWHYNAYPGRACDVPSHLYEFSFAPSPPVASRDVLRVGLGLGLRRVAA
jgi:cation diffusion facilitator CzcD-associated flavoprotein CzcO